MNSDKKEIEEWRDIPNYEGYYQASSLGRIRSLDRWVTYKDGRERLYRGIVIKESVNRDGYKVVWLWSKGNRKSFNCSQLVAMAFLGHNPDGHTGVVDHINGVRDDDRVDNLRVVSNRENTSTCLRLNENNYSSKYVGVSWSSRSSMWRAYIKHEGVNTSLGSFDNEIDASNAYKGALNKIKEGSFNMDDYKPTWSSKHKGISFSKRDNKWVAVIRVDGRRKYIGSFKTEEEAYDAYCKVYSEKDLVYLIVNNN